MDWPVALSEISTGNSIGIAAAGAAALVMAVTGVTWRICRAGFAGASALTPAANWAALRDVDKDMQWGWRDLLHLSAIPLFGIAFVYGTDSAIDFSFGADHFQEAGGEGAAPA